MSADAIADRFQAIGSGSGDTLSATPIGSATVPAATERLVFVAIGGGSPAAAQVTQATQAEEPPPVPCPGH